LERPADEQKSLKFEPNNGYAERPVAVKECRLSSFPMKRDEGDAPEAFVISEVHQAYNGFPVLQNISLTARPGQIISVIGANGSGKTTLLRASCGFLSLLGGEIRFGDQLLANGNATAGRDLISTSRILGTKVGLVSQQVEPWPHLSVLENVMLPLVKARGMTKEESKATALSWLKVLGLEGQSKKYSRQLSGGLKQRVVLARTLALDPKVLLLDEVTSALDPEWSAWLRDLMIELAGQGKIVINVSHKINLVREISDWVVFLDQGALVEQGAPGEILGDPKSEQLRLFLSCS
jgi:ABC-type polar amino acid transport system ATPase subunit